MPLIGHLFFCPAFATVYSMGYILWLAKDRAAFRIHMAALPEDVNALRLDVVVLRKHVIALRKHVSDWREPATDLRTNVTDLQKPCFS
jgi:hypothetical protein